MILYQQLCRRSEGFRQATNGLRQQRRRRGRPWRRRRRTPRVRHPCQPRPCTRQQGRRWGGPQRTRRWGGRRRQTGTTNLAEARRVGIDGGIAEEFRGPSSSEPSSSSPVQASPVQESPVQASQPVGPVQASQPMGPVQAGQLMGPAQVQVSLRYAQLIVYCLVQASLWMSPVLLPRTSPRARLCAHAFSDR